MAPPAAEPTAPPQFFDESPPVAQPLSTGIPPLAQPAPPEQAVGPPPAGQGGYEFPPYEAPPSLDGPPPEFDEMPPLPEHEAAPPPPAAEPPLAAQPPMGAVPPEPPPLYEAPPEAAPPGGEPPVFDVSGMPEEVRPQGSPDDFKLPPEYQELIGEPRDGLPPAHMTEPAEPEGQAPPWPYETPPLAEPSGEPGGPQAQSAEEAGPVDWPFDTVPATEQERSATAMPDAPEDHPVAAWGEQPATPPESDVEVKPPSDDNVVTVDEQGKPPAGQGTGEVKSFFFEDDVEEKKSDKKDNDSFWE